MYEERLRVQSTKLSGWRKFKDNVYWLFANYGIDLWHESVAALFVLLLGALIFSRPAAVLSGEGGKTEAKISWLNAFFLAVHQFLPLSLPVKPEWSPSRRVLLKWRQYPLLTAATYANFLQIIGWIIIPLTVAALAGVLRRTAQ